MMTNLHPHAHLILITILTITLELPFIIISNNTQSTSNIRNPCHILNALVTTEDLVHFLDSETFGFRDTEIGPDDQDEAEDEEKVECSEGDGFEHSGSNKGNDELEVVLVLGRGSWKGGREVWIEMGKICL